MIRTALLLAYLSVATVTDVRRRRIDNWTTYSGMLVALAGSTLATLGGFDTLHGTPGEVRWCGLVPLAESSAGLLACGGAMVACYVFFPGGVGGGDVKLIAMMGAFLGVLSGLEAMLWTFVLGACLALVALIWRFGLLTLVQQACRFVWYRVRLGRGFRLTTLERAPLQMDLYLSPCALLAAVIVEFQVVEMWA